MKYYSIYLTALLFYFISCSENKTTIYDVDIIIKGGTILDLSKNGLSSKDLLNKAILIKGDTIFDIVDIETLSNKQFNITNTTTISGHGASIKFVKKE